MSDIGKAPSNISGGGDIARLFQGGVRDNTTEKSRRKDAEAALIKNIRKNPHWKPLTAKGRPVKASLQPTGGDVFSKTLSKENMLAAPTNLGAKKFSCNVNEASSILHRTKFPWIVQKYNYMARNNTCFYPADNYVHDPRRAHDCNSFLTGRGGMYGGNLDGEEMGKGGCSVQRDIGFSDSTIVAARSGYYMINGDITYMHTDGSLCIVGYPGMECKCKWVHH